MQMNGCDIIWPLHLEAVNNGAAGQHRHIFTVLEWFATIFEKNLTKWLESRFSQPKPILKYRQH